MTAGTQGYPGVMSENTENAESTPGAQGDPAGTSNPSEEAYDAATDSDADPEMMNPRDLTGESSGETDPDVDPDSLNPRGDA